MPVQTCKIIYNKRLSEKESLFVMKIKGEFSALAGQFYMLRAWDNYPTLSRPISVHDIDEEGISFMYHVIGEGTEIFASLGEGDEISLQGPYGNGFPVPEEGAKVALIGGGMGVAPLLYTAKTLNKPDVYVGFREEVLEEDDYRNAAGELVTKIGGTILDEIDLDAYDVVYACGPLGMERALANMAKGKRAKVYVSLEKRMACGMGACLVCSCSMALGGNKKVCKDGPVFAADEVNFDEL